MEQGKIWGTKHSNLYIQAMEGLSDVSAYAYEKLVTLFKENYAIMAPFENSKDGLVLKDRIT